MPKRCEIAGGIVSVCGFEFWKINRLDSEIRLLIGTMFLFEIGTKTLSLKREFSLIGYN